MHEWLQTNQALLPWLLGISVGSFVAVLIAVPMVVIGLPAEYFAGRQRRGIPFSGRHPLIWMPLLIAKNLAALLLLLIGVAMLVLPGQGILTIIVGILLLDFPGKYPLERWLITRPPVLRLFNRIRSAAGKPIFEIHVP